MRDQLRKIHSSNWDYLIILDACRHDYFVKDWPRSEKVKCLRSPASETCSWLQRTFPDHYPLTIYSTNPFINRGQLETSWSYKPHAHFRHIVELWNILWSAKYGTVMPMAVYQWCKLMKPKPRGIIWFLQPHAPYLSRPAAITSQDFVDWSPESKKGFMDYDFQELKELYVANLRAVFVYVLRLLCFFKGKKIVITADHGELLGEYGKVGHPHNQDVPELRNVPWVEIKC